MKKIVIWLVVSVLIVALLAPVLLQVFPVPTQTPNNVVVSQDSVANQIQDTKEASASVPVPSESLPKTSS